MLRVDLGRNTMNQVQAQIQIEKPAPIVAPLVKVAKPALQFVLIGRPGSGGDLFAHTFAAFSLLGLFDGRRVDRNALLRVWGQRAITWHHDRDAIRVSPDGAPVIVESNKFEHTDGGYALTEFGKSFFSDRTKHNPEMVAVFLDLLSTGKTERSCSQTYRMTKPL